MVDKFKVVIKNVSWMRIAKVSVIPLNLIQNVNIIDEAGKLPAYCSRPAFFWIAHNSHKISTLQVK